jgi:hypothetical protein
MSIYTTPFRRFTLRLDGFASVRAGADLAEMVTKPLRFKGHSLWINYATSAGGVVQVEAQEADGTPIPGFTLAENSTLTGDAIEQAVTWKSRKEVAELEGRPVRLRFVLQEADLFALRFG